MAPRQGLMDGAGNHLPGCTGLAAVIPMTSSGASGSPVARLQSRFSFEAPGPKPGRSAENRLLRPASSLAPGVGPMLGTHLGVRGEFGKWPMKQKQRLEVTVAGRLPLARYRILEDWCSRSLRKRSELVGIVLDRLLEIYEEEADADQPLEHFVRRLHLDRHL
jgi:hypothetical protein